jgi:hypothetical protein
MFAEANNLVTKFIDYGKYAGRGALGFGLAATRRGVGARNIAEEPRDRRPTTVVSCTSRGSAREWNACRLATVGVVDSEEADLTHRYVACSRPAELLEGLGAGEALRD